jgi:hypothetical protein
MAAPPYVIMVKEKGVTPNRAQMELYQVFIYQSRIHVMNTLFRRDMLNRFICWTKVGETAYPGIRAMLDEWANSKYVDDTLWDATLPMPNTKDYVWMNNELNTKINNERFQISNDRSRVRKKMDLHMLGVKSDMISDLVVSPCFVIDIRRDTLNRGLKAGGINFAFKFKVI